MTQNDDGWGEDTRVFRPAVFGQRSIAISGTLRVRLGDSSQQVARVVVRAEGAGGDGPCAPCGEIFTTVYGCGPMSCWRGDGFGFTVFADQDSSPTAYLQLVDGGAELAWAPVVLENNARYRWEMKVNSMNWLEVRLWKDGQPQPPAPTLEFTNGGADYLPIAHGDNWQIEVKNVNGARGHSHTTYWDDVCFRED